MNSMENESYTKHLKKVIEARSSAENKIKRAIASIHYVKMSDADEKSAHQHIARAKELIINGNIILKTITASEHIGEEYRELLEETCHSFKEAIEEVEVVLAIIETLKNK